jgi:hypothetical protein
MTRPTTSPSSTSHYLLGRAEQEDGKAARAAAPGIAAIHAQLAREYRQRAAEIGISPYQG